jgi:hypothetical protein
MLLLTIATMIAYTVKCYVTAVQMPEDMEI